MDTDLIWHIITFGVAIYATVETWKATLEWYWALSISIGIWVVFVLFNMFVMAHSEINR